MFYKYSQNLGVSGSTLNDWIRKAEDNTGKVPTRVSSNCSSDEAKENAKLKKELRDTKNIRRFKKWVLFI